MGQDMIAIDDLLQIDHQHGNQCVRRHPKSKWSRLIRQILQQPDEQAAAKRGIMMGINRNKDRGEQREIRAVSHDATEPQLNAEGDINEDEKRGPSHAE